MTEDRIFDGGECDAGLADMQAMARRQFSVSLVVAFALLAVAGVTMVSAPHEASLEMAAWNNAVEAARVQVALPALKALRPD